MLQKFRQWAAAWEQEFQRNGLRTAFHTGGLTSKTGAYLDIDSDKFVARITLWESLELEFEAMDVHSQEQVIWEYHQARDFEEILTLNSGFIKRLV